MSPGGLGRCLRCGDAAFERLALLSAAGLAGSRRLPKVKRILTLPAGRFDKLFEQLGLAQGARAGTSAAAAALGAAAPAKGSADAAAAGDVGSDEVDAMSSTDDSDDEDDSGLLWPPLEGASNRPRAATQDETGGQSGTATSSSITADSSMSDKSSSSQPIAGSGGSAVSSQDPVGPSPVLSIA